MNRASLVAFALGCLATFATYETVQQLAPPAGPPLVAAQDQVGAGDSDRDLRTERVIELPEDGEIWQTIVIADKGSAAGRALAADFATVPRLASLAAQTKVYEYEPGHWWVKRYHAGDAAPMVLVQTDRGRVIYKAFGAQLPQGEQLADEIEAMIAQCCPPDKQPAGKPGERLSKIPVLRPTVSPASGQVPWGLIVVAAAVVLAILNRKSKA